MKPETRKMIDDAINEWMDTTQIDIESYVHESFVAGSRNTAGVGFDVGQHGAHAYLRMDQRPFIENGKITVTVPTLQEDGTYKFERGNIPWMKDKSEEFRAKIIDVIDRGITEGKPAGLRVDSRGKYPAGSIAEELSKVIGDEKVNAATIARTETARAYYHGEMERYAYAEVEYVQFMGGPGACDICQPLIGKVFKLGSQPDLPIHPNCRCDYRPYYPELSEIADIDSLVSTPERNVATDLLDDLDTARTKPPIATDTSTEHPVRVHTPPTQTSNWVDRLTEVTTTDANTDIVRVRNPTYPVPEFEIPTSSDVPMEMRIEDMPRMVAERIADSYDWSGKLRESGEYQIRTDTEMDEFVREHDEFLADKYLWGRVDTLEPGANGDYEYRFNNIFRVISGNTAERYYDEKAVGGYITDHDYTSWTTDQDFYIDWAHNDQPGKKIVVLVENVVPKKTPGFYIGHEQHEVLRQRGLIYDIVGVDGGYYDDDAQAWVKFLTVRTRGVK